MEGILDFEELIESIEYPKLEAAETEIAAAKYTQKGFNPRGFLFDIKMGFDRIKKELQSEYIDYQRFIHNLNYDKEK